jgi:hypothetical protein
MALRRGDRDFSDADKRLACPHRFPHLVPDSREGATTLTENVIRYEKLPGHRRGLILGSSLWLGPDHLLLVKSQRFREEYKRYYFGDIKAIAIAEARRVHISTRSLAIGAVWFMAQIVAAARRLPWAPWLMIVPLLLAIIWVYISLEKSCRCRIYTAVSADPLPSMYRIWTARKFLAIVEPHIRAAQGSLEAGWAQALQDNAAILPLLPVVSPVTPPAKPAAEEVAEALPPAPSAPAEPNIPPARRTLFSDAFLVLLVVGAVLDLLHVVLPFRAPQWVLAFVLVLQLATAAGVLVESYRRTLAPGINRLAIAKLLWCGLQVYFVRPLLVGIAASTPARAAELKLLSSNFFPYNPTLFAISAAVDAILAIVGVFMITRPRRPSVTGMFSTEI